MKNRKLFWAVVGMTTVSALTFTACQFTRGAYESAEYKVEKADTGFEIRNYPELTLASTPMKSEGKKEDNSFMRLFGYISGENQAAEKISMTTPVFMNDDEMSFVLPKEVAAKGAPKANEKEVKIETMPAGRYAVYRFAGGRKKTAQAKETLKQWLETNKLKPAGPMFSAGYDPPFTPTPLQRNEVLVPLK
jgi:DNA gyrase inhibitor GyrI